MAAERAEGFWWVRIDAAPYCGDLMRSEPVWRTLWLYGDSLMSHDPRDGGEFVAMKEQVVEWGPYLGKEPETVESLERKISEAFAAAVPRFVIPPQRD